MPALATDFSVFAHLNAEKATLYRAILGVFVSERTRFTIALRPPELAAGLAALHAADPDSPPPPPDEELAAALQQLVAWKNLLASRDTTDVATVEEFYRSRYLYQFSAAGEAAEQAIGAFFQHLHRPGELQVTTLRELLTLLDQLATELAVPAPDRDRVHLAFQSLVTRFEELTSRAQSFMRSLQSTVELHGIELDAFLNYKDALIDHLDRFLGELVLSTSRIAAALHDLATLNLGRRLLDDPVVYLAQLSDDERAYLDRQRGHLLPDLQRATGLEPEVRAEGLALADPDGDATDIGLPEEGTDGHLTLLLATHLGDRLRSDGAFTTTVEELVRRTRGLIREHQSHWRKEVMQPGAERILTARVLTRLAGLGLLRLDDGGAVRPLAAIGRYAMAAPVILDRHV